jgi:hypothetical protein
MEKQKVEAHFLVSSTLGVKGRAGALRLERMTST